MKRIDWNSLDATGRREALEALDQVGREALHLVERGAGDREGDLEAAVVLADHLLRHRGQVGAGT